MSNTRIHEHDVLTDQEAWQKEQQKQTKQHQKQGQKEQDHGSPSPKGNAEKTILGKGT